MYHRENFSQLAEIVTFYLPAPPLHHPAAPTCRNRNQYIGTLTHSLTVYLENLKEENTILCDERLSTLCHAKLDVMIDVCFQQFHKLYAHIDLCLFASKITKCRHGGTDP
jgi:hypothetical protein